MAPYLGCPEHLPIRAVDADTSEPNVSLKQTKGDAEGLDPGLDDGAIGDDEVEAKPSKQQKSSKERQRDRDIFATWMRNNEEDLITERKAKRAHADPDVLSLKQLMVQQESTRIIGSPRDYQMELFERAKKKNTIAVLDTGSGKTLIAVLLLRHIIDQELEDRAAGCEPRISFFLVDKVALVFQQHAVLTANLDQPTAAFSGHMNTHLWTRETWQGHFKENMVIACTAAVLQHCLARAYIRVDQINLLIFDEAHHAKKEHPYAQIIRDFYLKLDAALKKPKIFGMTASPVDGEADEEDVMLRARELETLLHSTIATASDLSLFQGSHSTKRATTELLKFPRTETHPLRTGLHQELWNRYSTFPAVSPLFPAADTIRFRLGSWCGDRFWYFAFSEAEANKREAKLQRRADKLGMSTLIEGADADLERLREANDYVQNHEYDDPIPEPGCLSLRVLALLNKLQEHFERSDDHKCLVFVERRATARLLNEVVQRLCSSNIRSGILTGTNTSNLDSMKYSHHAQALAMMKFRKGELNCLLATSVGEEGIDVPECNVVIRFDPAKTMIQYVQSRGRARKQNSKFYILHEQGNQDETNRLNSIIEAEHALRNFCSNLPEDRLVNTEIDSEVGYVLAKDYGGRIYREPTTGATLTYEFALIVLHNFAARLPHEDDADLSIHYSMHHRQGKYICEVILPEQSPIRSAVGKLAPRKLIARQSAAFDACIMLIKNKHLDENFLPTYAKNLPALRNARLAITSKKQDAYEMKSKPAVWAQERGKLPSTYFITCLTLQDEWDRPVRAFALITRMHMPQLPEFPIYRLAGDEVNVECRSLTSSVKISDVALGELTSFTLAIFKDIYNKSFEHAPEKMSYWIAPVCSDKATTSIDWDLVGTVSSQVPYTWEPEMGVDHLKDKFFVDPFDGGRRLFTSRVATDLRPEDPPPKGVAKGYKTSSIIEYSVSLWTKSRRNATWAEDQPVVEAEKIMHRLNILATPNDADQAVVTRCYVIPQPFKISLLPTDVAAMGLLFPAIIHRIESYLIALEFCDEVGVVVPPGLALEALTKDSDNTDDHQADQVNFQRGMGDNYERLEFIGDCFLKMATTIATYISFAVHDEFWMHCDRMVMLTNANLCKNAKDREWYKYVRGKAFSRRTWYPHNITLLEGKGFKTQDQQAVQHQPLGDKTIADICEALIGAAFVAHVKDGNGSTSQLDGAVKAVTSFVAHDTHAMQCWMDYYSLYAKSLPKYQTGPSNASQRDLAKKVELEHSYTFKYPRLLRSAFTHASLPRAHEGVPSYQRLEFLGDSLLDMTAVSYLYHACPNKDPGWLTEHKMAIVSNQFLGALCVKLGFHRHLRHNHGTIEHQVRAYVEDIEEAERLANGQRDYWTAVKGAPKCLPDIVESYVGAMFIDSEFNYAEVQRFFDTHIKWFFEDMSMYDTFANNHPVVRLQSLLTEDFGCARYRLMAQERPSEDGMNNIVVAVLMIHEKVVAHGQSTGAKYAKLRAAKEALEKLEGKTPLEFRRNFGCTCTPAETSVINGAEDPDMEQNGLGSAI